MWTHEVWERVFGVWEWAWASAAQASVERRLPADYGNSSAVPPRHTDRIFRPGADNNASDYIHLMYLLDLQDKYLSFLALFSSL